MTRGELLANLEAGRRQAESRLTPESLERFGDWSAPLHVSFGVREITQDADAEALIAEADAAMYAKKRERKTG